MKPPVSRWGLRKPNSVVVIFGAVGSGKTSLSYKIADAIHGDRSVYCNMSKRYGRPSYYRPFTGEVQPNSVLLLNDAALEFHARKWRDEESIELFMVQQLRRHDNVDYIWDVQNSASLDVEVVRAADATVLREPSLNQLDEERGSTIRKYERAEPLMEAAGGWDVTNAYVEVKRRTFVVKDIELPGYWNDNISMDDITKKAPPLWRRIM
jgi:hypothetical protein